MIAIHSFSTSTDAGVVEELFTMKQIKKLSALAAGPVVIGLLLGTSMAQAEEVCLDGDTVTGIKDLVVVTEQLDTINIDVEFRYTTGFEIYGSGLDNFPFNGANAEEDVITTMIAINDALDASNPVPASAGQSGQDVFFIGAEEETAGSAGLIAAIGSENLTGSFWDLCTQANDCLASAAVLKAGDQFTYADLAKAENGASCDGSAPPGPTFTITAGITGSWYDRARDGEGYNIEIIGSTLDPLMLAYFYTYDDTGNQMWLVGTGPVNGDTATVPMQVTSGAVFGPGFDPADVIREDWGTVTFIFSSCDAGTATYNSTSFGTGTSNIERVSSVTGLSCP